MSTGLPAWPGSQAPRGSLRPRAAAPPPFDDGEPLVVRVDPAGRRQRRLPGRAGDREPVAAGRRRDGEPRRASGVEAGGRAEVEGEVRVSPDGAVLIWTRRPSLAPGVVHLVAIAGVRDRRGLPVRRAREPLRALRPRPSDLMVPLTPDGPRGARPHDSRPADQARRSRRPRPHPPVRSRRRAGAVQASVLRCTSGCRHELAASTCCSRWASTPSARSTCWCRRSRAGGS